MDRATIDRTMKFMKEQDVRFVRLAFCDIFGQLKNLSVSIDAAEKVLEKGVGFNASAIRGFMNVQDSDLILFPDPDTLKILSWRPEHGRVARFLCSICHADGRPFEGDARQLLKTYSDSLEADGYSITVSSECEFYLFKLDDEGNPTDTPMDRASYFEVAPIDKGENIRREICLTMEQMGLSYEASHHEKGPGQNEIRFSSSTLLNSADNLITFKDIVKVTSNRMGLFASFLPKPLFNECGSGLTFNISIGGRKAEGRKAELTMHMVGGILRRIKEMTIFLNPIANSYERLGETDTPALVNYACGNQKVLIKASPELGRVKTRSADPACNPYLASLLLCGAAMEGIRDEVNPDDYNTAEELPDTLNDAIKLAEKSEFIKTMISETLFDRFLEAKREDWEESSLSGDPMLKAKNMEFPVT
ncbi:MAG: glutamine synthetase [Spirochaetales bacterium]|nr:glutamine synthetase [Spirochaetales bacterium]